MRSAQIKFREVLQLLKRRWKLIATPTILVAVLSTVGAFMLPRKYESSTTILVRPDQTLSKVSGYEMMAALEEQLRNLDAIVYSRTFMQALVDSLHIGDGAETEAQRQALWEKLKSQILVNRLGMDSFRIIFLDSDPSHAKKGAEVVSDLFIKTKTAVENRQNSYTVQILEKQVEEYRQAFENSTRSLVSVMKQNVDDQPTETRSLYAKIDDIEKSMSENHTALKTYQDAVVVLRELPSQIRRTPDVLRSESGKQPLLQLQREDLPYAADLRALITKYDEASRRYTPQYPEVVKLEGEMATLLERMRIGIESEISRLQEKRWDLEKRRTQIIEELKKSSVSTRVNQEKESGYESNLRLYSDLKFKLEQARLAEAVGSQGANQFIILDPAYLPVRPTKPNRTMITAGGFAVGLLLGIITAILVELLDTTIRSPRQIQVYQKPIIALLPDGDRSR
ncbi:MAG: Wzz protein [Bacteroidetes bacterium]|nr:Wzz protein [Bacteroidota bacterium]